MEFNGNPHQFISAPSMYGQYDPRFAARSWFPQFQGVFPQSGGFPGRGRGVTPSQFGVKKVFSPPRMPPMGARTPSVWTLNSRHLYRGPQQGTSLVRYQGRPINRPLGNYRGHYRFQEIDQVAATSPRFHPKNMRQAGSQLTGHSISNVSSVQSTSSSRNIIIGNNSTTKTAVKAGSPRLMQVTFDVTHQQTQSNSKQTSDVSSNNKEPPSSDTKNPSIAKVVPFSHQPTVNTTRCLVGSIEPPVVEKSSSNAISQVHSESLITSASSDSVASLSQVNIYGQHCHCITPQKDGIFQPVSSTILSRQRASQYVDKGTRKDDSILIDSDEEEEEDHKDKKASEGTVSVNDPSCCDLQEPGFHEIPRKRAKMSIEISSEERSLPIDKATTPVNGSTESNISGNGTRRETSAGTLAMIVEGVRQSFSEGHSSSAASTESMSTMSSRNLIEDAPLLSNPQIIQRLLEECNEISKPFKKLKVSPRNLLTAVKECNVHKVLALLVGGCDPNLQVIKSKGKTPMHAAAAGGYVDIIAILRLAGCDLNLVDSENRTPLFDAVNYHKVKAVEYFIECGAHLTSKDSKGTTCFHLAVRQGHADIIKILFKTGQFDINEKDDGGWTPLMWAAESKQYDATLLLIEQGANVHLRDLELNVPLHWAALSGNPEVCKLLLNEATDINSINIHKETPLHIVAREGHYSCVQLFLSRGASIHLKNKDGHTPCEIADPSTRQYCLLNSKAQLESSAGRTRARILHSDISRGQENVSISCINEVDDEPFPKFTFVKESCEVYNGMINWSILKFEGCQCERSCRSGKSCHCSERSEQQTIWYQKNGLLKGDLQKCDRPLIFECNRLCSCWSFCKNRVVQKGMQYPLQLFRTLKKGWGVRSLAEIPEGSFLCEYTGELIPDSEADDRDDDSYLFDLDCKESTNELFCIDAKEYGNISRFINHSCEPNIFPLRVFINHRDIRFPRIAFFATKSINLHEEICFNYGDRFWSVKKKEFYCECGSTRCKYRKPNS
ncbi:histone-lysine N-methyltransferase EHMT2-like isoform X1 [Acropora muricata]|uniref:histone-lysine N-methyltransferase EHMT2-like isoform X1 n=2 Tax=Acropora muricata TaxID=159855 RepID=UPI0034E612DB